MDIVLLKTFLEVAATGSFVSASERLFVTQSAVSLRIQRLEDELGRVLFNRSRAGAEMTPAGKAFEPYALSVLKIWEEARQKRRQAERIEQACRELAVLFRVEWSPPENVETISICSAHRWRDPDCPRCNVVLTPDTPTPENMEGPA